MLLGHDRIYASWNRGVRILHVEQRSKLLFADQYLRHEPEIAVPGRQDLFQRR